LPGREINLKPRLKPYSLIISTQIIRLTSAGLVQAGDQSVSLLAGIQLPWRFRISHLDRSDQTSQSLHPLIHVRRIYPLSWQRLIQSVP